MIISAPLGQPTLEAWGRAVGEAAASGDLRLPLFIALRGPLGAGKSVLARAIARGAGVSEPMPSPTYNLRFTYDAPTVRVHHLDLYRLDHPDDVWELGWQDLATGREIVLVEWPERAEALLPDTRWEVRLTFPEDGEGGSELRRIRLERLSGAPELPDRAALPDAPDLADVVPNGTGGEDQ